MCASLLQLRLPLACGLRYCVAVAVEVYVGVEVEVTSAWRCLSARKRRRRCIGYSRLRRPAMRVGRCRGRRACRRGRGGGRGSGRGGVGCGCRRRRHTQPQRLTVASASPPGRVRFDIIDAWARQHDNCRPRPSGSRSCGVDGAVVHGDADGRPRLRLAATQSRRCATASSLSFGDLGGIDV